MFSIERLQAGLNTKCLGRTVKYLDITPSTNDDTWECYLNNNPEGTLIIAGHQSQGRGRRQSKWSSTQGKSLTFSFLLLPEIEIEKLYFKRSLNQVEELTCHTQAASILKSQSKSNETLLDIGCGTGYFYHALRNQNINLKYHGLDPSMKLIDIGGITMDRVNDRFPEGHGMRPAIQTLLIILHPSIMMVQGSYKHYLSLAIL